MCCTVNTQCKQDVEKWDRAIRDAAEMLERMESKADRLRHTIRSLREFRDAGEPWSPRHAPESQAAQV